jgi:hypothetical protein
MLSSTRRTACAKAPGFARGRDYGLRPYALSAPFTPGMWGDPDRDGAHGLNERMEGRSVYVGRDYMFDLVKAYAD